MKRELMKLVKERAHACCEYCLVPEVWRDSPFQIDHIYATQHGGLTTEANLCFSCARCNRFKGPNIAGLDPDRVEDIPTPLYHPRRDVWSVHFQLAGDLILGKTAQGRTTVSLLNMNIEQSRRLRRRLIKDGHYPPPHLR